MITIHVDDKEYVLRFGIRASLHKDLVNRMFKILTASYIVKGAGNENTGMMEAVLDGTAEMVADIPETVLIAFHAGLQQYHPMDNVASMDLLEKYMLCSGKTFSQLYEELKQGMEDDGFFDLSGLTDMINKMNTSIKESTEETTEQKVVKMPKAPEDHKPKSKTGTK